MQTYSSIISGNTKRNPLENYRHPYAIDINLQIYKPIELYAYEGFLNDEAITMIEAYQMQYSKLGFEIEYDDDAGYVYIDFEGNGKIEDMAINIMPFLNVCSKLEIYADCSCPYLMTWGDYESGAIYFETNENNDDNKVIITGISNHGDTIMKRIPWKH